MMKTVRLKKVDEEIPNIQIAADSVVLFLLTHNVYIVPFTKILTNMPTNCVGNPRFLRELEVYLHEEVERNKYYIGDVYAEDDIRMLIRYLTSYFAYYDDGDLQNFLKMNSRYSYDRETPETIQKKAFQRLKGFLFEKLVEAMIRPMYEEKECLFECGCEIEVDGRAIRVQHDGISRKTVDVAGLNSLIESGDMLECKVQPIWINEATVKYMHCLLNELRAAGYRNIRVGFATAGSKAVAQYKLMKALSEIQIKNAELLIYNLSDLREWTVGA